MDVSFPCPTGRLLAVRKLDLQVDRGEVVAVCGISGCGKTTVLRCVAALQEPSDGMLRVGGLPPKVYRDRRGLGFCFQETVMFEWRTVMENLLLPAEVRRADMEEAGQHARELLAQVGLSGFEGLYPSELSGGMKQRLNLIRSLLLRPELVLLDESFSAVDSLTRESLWVDVHRLWRLYRPTVLLVTHSIPEAVFLANRVLVMSARPGTIKRSFKVSLPDDRDRHTLTDSTFHRLCDNIREAL